MTILASRSDYTLHIPENAPHQRSVVDQKPNRQRREANAVPVAESGGSRKAGDRAMAERYGKALLKSIEGSHNEVMVENIAPHSTFGQWWVHLGKTMDSEGVKDWLLSKNADMSTVRINARSGAVTFQLKGAGAANSVTQMYDQSDASWSAVSRLVMVAAKVVGSNSRDVFKPPLSADSSTAPLWLIRQFYAEEHNPSHSATQERANALIRDKTFVALPGEAFAGLDEDRSEHRLNEQKAALGDDNTRSMIVVLLGHIARQMEAGYLSESSLTAYMEKPLATPDPDGTYPEANLDSSGETSVEQYLKEYSLNVPTNPEEIKNLIAALVSPELKSPPYGNYDGAMAWPIPISTTQQQKLKAMLHHGKIGNISVGSAKSVLDYLMQGRVFDPSDLRNPRAVIDSLIQSPKGKALGEAIKAEFHALAVEGSAEDWLLTALSFFNSHPTYPMSSKGDIPLAQLERGDAFGRTAQEIVARVADDIVSSGAATSPENARVHAYLLLSSQAPEYLVKDIPEKVTVGSHSWVSFTTAVARLEAKAPGSTASMSYGDVILAAEIAPISAQEQIIEYEAQERALKFWGLANGLGYPTNETSQKKVRDAYNEQISELKTASGAQNTPMPIAKDIALAELKTALPHMTEKQLEEKCLTLEPYIPDYPGPYSVLDLYLKGKFEFYSLPTQGGNTDYQGNFIRQDSYKGTLVSSSTNVNITELLPTLKQLPNAAELFAKQFSEYSHSIERNTVSQVKHLIATQPLQVRRDFEFGEIRIFREENVTYANFTGTKIVGPRTPTSLLVNIKREGKTRTYEVDIKAGKIVEREGFGLNSIGKFTHIPLVHQPPKIPVEFRPDRFNEAVSAEVNPSSAIPNSFSSHRTSYITKAFAKHMNVEGLRAEAQGLTTLDTETPFFLKATNFFLNLIPFKSAIGKFLQGDIVAGFKDLALDAFGFAVGAGVVAKGSKALAAGASATSKAIKAGKILGRAAVGAINPFDGLIGLGQIGVGLAKKGKHIVVDGFRSITRNADDVGGLLLSSKHLDKASVGTFKVGSETVQGPAIFKNDNWYAYNPTKKEAFGPALINFKPTNAARPLSHADLTKSWDKLMAKPGRSPGVCYTASVQLGEAEKTLSSHVLDAIKKSASTVPGTNYTPAFLDLMDIKPSGVKSIFNPAEISESGLINFKSRHGEKNFKHTAYIQKTEKGELFLYNFNGLALDSAMLKSGHPLKQVSGGGFVYDISHGNHKGLQDYLDHAIDGAEYTFTTASTLNANVQKLAS